MNRKEKMNKLMTMLEDKCNEHIIKYFAKQHRKKLRMRFSTPRLIKAGGAGVPLGRNKRIAKQCNNKLVSCGSEVPKNLTKLNISTLLSSSTTF